MSGLVGMRLRRQPRNDGNASPMAGPGGWGNEAVGAYSTPCHCAGHLSAAGRCGPGFRAAPVTAAMLPRVRWLNPVGGTIQAGTNSKILEPSLETAHVKSPIAAVSPIECPDRIRRQFFQGRNISSVVMTLSPAPERLMCIAVFAADIRHHRAMFNRQREKTCLAPNHEA